VYISFYSVARLVLFTSRRMVVIVNCRRT
jgi:hypothetical protein